MKQKVQITTKAGDNGMTRLYSGEQVPKTALRLDAYGDVDELTSLLGVAKQYVTKKRLTEEITSLQRQLYVLCSELATTPDKLSKLPARVDAAFMARFEETVTRLYDVTDIPNDFIVPGATKPSAYLDVARAVSRRVERKVARLIEAKEVTNLHVLTFVNRLSDYLYLMARFEEDQHDCVKGSHD